MSGKGRSFLTLGFIAALAASLLPPAANGDTGSNDNAPSAAKTDNTPGAPKPAEKAEEPVAASSNLEVELREVRELLQAQLQRIEALEAELRLVRSNAATTPAPEPVATKTVETAAPAQEVLEKRLTSAESKLKGIGPFTFSGDLRLRDEPFIGGPANQSLVRNRERYRLRFNVNAKLNDDVSGGFSLASGDVNDPISTNQTTNQFYTRKPFLLDRAFINYHPGFFKPLTLTGGKFAYPWYNTELTWDKDLNPEGVAQTLAFNLESTPVLKRVAFVGFELPFSETAGVSLNNKSVVASAVYGGQLQTTWQLGGRLKLSAYAGFYNYHNADPIALAAATANAGSPGTGVLPLGGNRVQNSVRTTTSTSAITIEQDGVPKLVLTDVKTITGAQFASKFGLLDTIARFDVRTPFERWPIAVIGDYVQNTGACANVGKLPALGTTTTSTASITVTQNAPCNSRERRAYWAEVRFGQAQEKGDWQFAYTRAFIEREAVLSLFDASDIRQASNVSQHRAEVFYQAHKNVQLAFTGYIGRPINFGNSAPPENLLKRLQFDVIYKF
jgi:putative porin